MSIITVIVNGGWSLITLMSVLGLTSILSLTVFLERFFYLLKAEKENNLFFKHLITKFENKELSEAIYFCDNSKDVISSNIVKTVLAKSDQSKSELKEFVEEAANREIPKLESKVPILGTIASIAPLMGLLGTVLGLIESLHSMQELAKKGAINSADLLGGIWTALLTTAAGLFVAIPSLTAHNYLVTKVNGLVTYINNRTNEVIELIITNKEKKGSDKF